MSFAPNTENLAWGAETFNLGPKDNYRFGLDEKHIVRLKTLLAAEGFQLREGSRDGLALEHIKATMAYLKERNLFDTDIKMSVEKLFAPKATEPAQQAAQPVQQSNEPAETQDAKQTANIPKNERAIRELQALLTNFVWTNSPLRVTVDGRWGPLTERIFKMVMESYGLEPVYSLNAVERLRAISQHLVRIHCDDKEIISSIPQNPFCIIHKEAKEYEFTPDGILRRMRIKEELIRFRSLWSKEGTAQSAFHAFAAWFMLLNMQGSHEKERDVEVVVDVSGKSSHLPSEFILQPKYVMEYAIVPQQIFVKLNVRTDDEVIAVMFSRSMGIRFTKSHISTDSWSTFYFGDFFTQPPNVIGQEVQPLLKADFVKFFVVTSDFANNSAGMPSRRDEPSDAMSTDLLKLMTAPREHIVFTTLVGIVLKPGTVPADGFRKRVEEIYTAQPISVMDDIQKNRWGGRSENNGKKMIAHVSRDASLGSYDLTITVRSIRDQPLEGEVAFFLSNIFTEKTRYATADNGEATLRLIVNEAFTVGAYTEDGTMLELDLRQVEGLPPEFYYRRDELA